MSSAGSNNHSPPRGDAELPTDEATRRNASRDPVASAEGDQLLQQDNPAPEEARDQAASDYDLSCGAYLKRRLGSFMLLLAWGLASSCAWGAGLWCCGQLRSRIHSHQLLLAAATPLLLASSAGLLARHFQLGNIGPTVRYYWRPILFSSILLSASLQLAFRAAQRLPLASDAACIWFSYAGIMSLPLCFILQISCTHYGILAAVLTVLNLALLTRPTFLRDAVAGVGAFGGGNVSSTVGGLHLPPTPPGDFVGCAAAAVFLAVGVTVIYWKLSGVSALPLLTLTCALLCAASIGIQLAIVDHPLRLPQLLAVDAPLAFGAVAGASAGLPILLHWLRSERSRLFQLVTSVAISVVHLIDLLVAKQPPDAIGLVAAALVQVATALVTLGQMRHESWLQYREDSKYKYSRLTILPDTPFQTLHDGHTGGSNGSASPGLAETSFNSVTVRRQSDSGDRNGDPFFQEVSLADERQGCANVSVGGNGVDAWKPLKIK